MLLKLKPTYESDKKRVVAISSKLVAEQKKKSRQPLV